MSHLGDTRLAAGQPREAEDAWRQALKILADLDHPLDEDVLVCGDRREDKARVAELVERVPGLRAVDCGKLEMARITEQLTPLIISINVRYKARAGIHVTGLAGDLW